LNPKRRSDENEDYYFHFMCVRKIMSITKAEALEMIRNTSRFHHSCRVAVHMAALAEYFGENPLEWELAGLLHDLDYDETVNQRELHGILAAEKLRGKLSSRALNAIMSHDNRTDVEPESRLARILIAADALDAFIEIISVEENLSIEDIANKLKDKQFDKPWLPQIIKNCEYEDILLGKFIELKLNQ
jgi:putative nucleotidyltransferase with HDIG domain